jgi:exosome complex RNA-binding protein Csl4
MSTTRLIRHAAAAALMVASAGACAGNLGNVLGGVLGGGGTGSQSAQLSGTIRGVDTRSQQIAIQEPNGQTVPVSYDSQTQVVYQNQNYSPTSLENGDRVTARVQATNGNSYYTDYVQVDQSVSGTNTGSVSNNVQSLQGTVRQVDRRNGLFTIDMNNGNTLTVTMPYNPAANDVNRFNNLRSGDFVRFYGTYLSSSQIQLRQFN